MADHRRSSAPDRPASRSRVRCASSRRVRCAATSAPSTRARCASLIVDGGERAPRDVRPQPVARAPRRRSNDLGVELQIGARVTGVDALGVDVPSRTARPSASPPARSSGLRASRRRRWPGTLAEACGRRGRPGRAHRGAARPDAARPSRGVRGRRHDHASTTCRASPRSRCRAACTPRTRSAVACAGSRRPSPFRYRDLGSVATIGRFRAIFSWRVDPPEWLPGLGRVGVRAPRVPQRLRQSLHHAHAVGPLDDRATTGSSARSASGTRAAT